MTALRQRRAAVRQLADEGLSQRRIARRLGVSKDTVRRDLAELAQADATDADPPTPLASSASATPAPDGEPPAPEGCATPAPDDEPPAPEPAPPPPAGAPLPDDWLAIGLDDDLRDHLQVLQSTGRTLSAAIREAVEHYADAHRDAWDHEECPRGTAPRIYGVRFRPYAIRRTADTAPADTPRTNVLDKIST